MVLCGEDAKLRAGQKRIREKRVVIRGEEREEREERGERRQEEIRERGERGTYSLCSIVHTIIQTYVPLHKRIQQLKRIRSVCIALLVVGIYVPKIGALAH